MKAAKFFTLMLAPALARSRRSLNGRGAIGTFLSKGSLIGLALCLASSVGQAAALAHEKIVLRSGTVNGLPGSIPTQDNVGDVDDNITYLTDGSCCSELRSVPFSAPDFDDARSGPAAELIVPHPPPVWLPSLPSDPDARWINWNHGFIGDTTGSGRPAASVLYAYDFEVETTTDITAASIDFYWAADDRLGDPDGGANVVGVYVNGIPLSMAFRGCCPASEGSASQSGIEALLNPGPNTLYVYQRDVGGSVSGIIFSATINIYDRCTLAGDRDDFASPDDPADVIVLRPEFKDWLGVSLPFDVIDINEHFGYSFINLPQICCPASLEIHLMASGNLPETDSIHLQFSDDPPAFAWSFSMNDLKAFFGGVGDWSTGDDLTATLDLCALPLAGGGTLNLLPRINDDGFLDVYVQDDTAVDYIELCYNLCNCIDPPPDMVAWWTGDNDLAYAADTLGIHHGIPVGTTAAWIPKVGSGTLAFSPGPPPGPAYVVVPNAPGLNFGTGELTIDAWIKTTADGYRPIVENGPQDLEGPGGYRFFLDPVGDDATEKLWCIVYDAGGNPFSVMGTSTPSVNDGNWHHVACTLSRNVLSAGVLSDVLTVYIDGEPANWAAFIVSAGGVGNINSVAANLLIGAGPSWATTPTDFFAGPIDEIEIFSRALTAFEIEAIFEADSAGKCKCVEPPPDMVAWWPADPSRPECGPYLIGDATCDLDGKVDAAFSLDGDGDFVEIPDDPAQRFAVGVDLSCDAWILPTSDLDGILPIVDKRDTMNGYPKGFYLYLSSGRLAFQLWDGGFPPALCEFIAPFPAMTPQEWHHVAVTVDRDETEGGKLYVDGQVVLTFNPTDRQGAIDSQSPLLIGHNHNQADPCLPGQWFFEGMIDEVELFDRALTLQDIRSVFLADSAGKCRPCRGRGIRVSQESAPNADDFDDHVLGCIDVFETSYSPPDYYRYGQKYVTSFSNPDFLLTADRSHLFLVQGAGLFSLVIVHDKPGNVSPGGKAEMYFELFDDPNDAFRTVEDDPSSFPPDTYFPTTLGTRSPDFASMNEWDTCCTDGQVLSELDGDWTMFVEFTEFDSDPLTPVFAGLDDGWFAYSAVGSTIELALVEDRRVRLDCCKTLPCGDCPTDVDASGNTGPFDLASLLAAWGPVEAGNCLDANDDGAIGPFDLATLLATWGPCP